MTVDYDLIIVGGAPVGRYAAMKARLLGARVALIEPPTPQQASPLLYPLLVQLNRALQQTVQLDQWGYNLGEIAASEPSEPPLNWQKFCQWATTLTETLETSSAVTGSLAALATKGVEVILGNGSFYRRPHLSYAVADRLLRARAYLLTPATQSSLPTIEGLSAVNSVRLDRLETQTWQTLPERILILGNDPKGIALAQVLNRLGSQVTLITSGNRFLPGEDPEAAFLLQAQLEAEGITLLTQTQLSQVRQFDQTVWVQAGDRAIEADVILLATKPQLALTPLNLEAAGVKWQPHRIIVNRKLQTTHSRIYACGESLGGYSFTALDYHEADVAVTNALFLPVKQVNYQQIPWVLFTEPQLARIGLTEMQARQHYGEDVLVGRQSFKSLPKAQLGENTTGFCKLITRRNGEILGVHCLGTEASEWIGTVALAMQQRLKLKNLAESPRISPTFAEVIQQTAAQLQHQHRPEWQRELLETWFNFRRSR